MRYAKGSVEYIVNLESFHEMEDIVPMTRIERFRLINWIKKGHDLESNPWLYKNSDLSPMNYLKAFRIRYGASHGPWDSWEFENPRKDDSNDHVSYDNDDLSD